MREALLQRTLADVILDPTEEDFRLDPAAYATARGLAPGDAEGFARQEERILLYRELARNGLKAPLENTFPVLQALLGPEAWEEAVAGFLAARLVQSPYYRDIAPAFVAWLAEGAWGQDRWPAILELAHYEYLEILVTQWPASSAGEDLEAEPAPGRRLVLDPAARVLSYAYAVHRATEAGPEPAGEPAHLLLHRDPAGDFGVLELTEATAALLARAQAEPLGDALAALGLAYDDTLLELLGELRRRGALLGFQA